MVDISLENMAVDAPIFIAGHNGMVGSALLRLLKKEGFTNLLTVSRNEVDLRDQSAVNNWFAEYRPTYVFLAAGTVGGVYANATRQAEFLYDNLMIHATVVEASRQNDVRKLLYLGSSCIYPRSSHQPIVEEALLSGPLEPTNEGYAIAKIAGIKLCQFYREQYGKNFITVMPTNLYGPNDNFDLLSSHVLPALLRKFHEAKTAGAQSVSVWGSGKARREFLHVDDLAEACLHLMRTYSSPEHVNVGTGIDISIRELATMIGSVIYPEAELAFDATKPDGMPRKVLDVSRLTELGWKANRGLREGIEETYAWFLENQETARGAQRGVSSL